MRRYLIIAICFLFLFSNTAFIAEANNSFSYVHDPRLNPKAMEDIIVDETAVYGFAPNPNSERMAAYIDFDWSDSAVVESGRQDRIAYHESIQQMYTLLAELQSQGKTTEEIARTLSNKRNEIRIEVNASDPEKLAAMKESNLQKYGNENGPDADSLYAKYGSWEMVIDKAFSVNSGMDALLGLYDDYYEVYVAAGQISETSIYTVQQGDYLTKIAESYLGDKNRWREIYNLNTNLIKTPELIYAGQQLVLP